MPEGVRPYTVPALVAIIVALLGGVGGLVALIFGWVGDGLNDHDKRIHDLELEDRATRQRLQQLEACHYPGQDGAPTLGCHQYLRPHTTRSPEER